MDRCLQADVNGAKHKVVISFTHVLIKLCPFNTHCDFHVLDG